MTPAAYAGHLFMVVMLAVLAIHGRRALRRKESPSPRVMVATGASIAASKIAVVIVNQGHWALDWILAVTWLVVTASVVVVARRLAARQRATAAPDVEYSGDPTRLPPWARPEAREP